MTLGEGPAVAQARASEPGRSVWVAASAGTGKTKVLTDRVLRLMLPDADGRPGTPPGRILCITFTRAAAAEMAYRLVRRLSGWAITDDAKLVENLAALTGARPTNAQQQAARRLLAQVLETPGGLNIQTIHAFCQSVLRRFPLEAGLSPHFEAADEQTAADLLRDVRDRVFSAANADVAAALAVLSGEVHEDRLAELLAEIVAQRGKLARAIRDQGGFAALTDAVHHRLNVSTEDTDAALLAAACEDVAFDGPDLKVAVDALSTGAATDRERADAIARWLAAPAERPAQFGDYESAFLTADGRPKSRLITKKPAERFPDALPALLDEADRLVRLADRRKALRNACATSALLTLGHALTEAYADAKARRGLLDYDDQVDLTANLLERPGIAPWVLFKLDGGIDHLLIDEAQDTNPDQWRVVAALAEEFFAGSGDEGRRRTLFVVGDEKQSIFSFQRADPREFAHMRAEFDRQLPTSQGGLSTVALQTSFRSGPAILQAVDAVFAHDRARHGVTADASQPIRHLAHRASAPGLVEVWPLFGPSKTDEDEPWTPPVTQRRDRDPGARLASQIAETVRSWIDDRIWLPSVGRGVEAGDILILLRTRNRFFNQLVRALKDQGVAVAGLDRMVLRHQLAVKDLLAVLQVLLLPEDDLTLAAALKSPLIGFDEPALFRLAHGRITNLWRALTAGDDPRDRAASAWLGDLLALADYVPPFELLTRILTHPCPADPVSGRRALLGRLGAEAEDPIDELLTLACGVEARGPPSLQRFVHMADTGDVTVKREFDQTGPRRLRIMTVHGAKGLQAPIVIMPDTVSRPRRATDIVWPDEEIDVPLWSPRREREDAVTEAMRARADAKQQEEYRRLLYVALTRAEDRLVIAGHHGPKLPGEDCWYRLCRDALEPVAQAVPQPPFDDPVLRLSVGDIDRRDAGPAIAGVVSGTLPDWARRPAPPEPQPPKPLAPSRPDGEDPATLTPLQPADDNRFKRGRIVHALLQSLPDLAEDLRRAVAQRYLAGPSLGLSPDTQNELLTETLAVLSDPGFAAVFGPGSRSEVPITGVIGGRVVSGQIDRLVVRNDSVLIVDYKTNRPPPATANEVPPLYWRQMAAYRAAVGQIYPDRPVLCALLWTVGPKLMPLDGAGLDAHAPQAGLV